MKEARGDLAREGFVSESDSRGWGGVYLYVPKCKMIA